MGNAESMESQLAVIRSRAAPVRLPMPDPAELEERFSIALNSMNLPPDKVRLLRSYDNEKKWELICDQVGGVNKGDEFECVPAVWRSSEKRCEGGLSVSSRIRG
ncbi:formin-like protein 2 [Plectropomus leopardus]|uniref:formin-like protein 2 n=1 Tax=Plectropomus leopardus TaxID=160734 RepID=UPI001C4D9192|nr:formin-like protein 2 [Plectropomus leopardus]